MAASSCLQYNAVARRAAVIVLIAACFKAAHGVRTTVDDHHHARHEQYATQSLAGKDEVKDFELSLHGTNTTILGQLGVVGAIKLTYLLYFGAQTVKESYHSYIHRQMLVENLTSDHSKLTKSIIDAAYGVADEPTETIRGELDKNIFLPFKELFKQFHAAKTMCIDEDSWFSMEKWIRSAKTLIYKTDKKKLVLAQTAISGIVNALEKFADTAICPQLMQEVQEDLDTAQSTVEKWEKLTNVSWYAMLQGLASSESDMAGTQVARSMATWSLNKIDRKFFPKRNYLDPQLCLDGFSGMGTGSSKHGYDDHELSGPNLESIIFGDQGIHELAKKIQSTMDRIGVNLEDFELMCQSGPSRLKSWGGRNGLIDHIHSNWEQSHAEATAEQLASYARQWKSVSCDPCLKHGFLCRGISGEKILKSTLKAFLYGWDHIMLQMIQNAALPQAVIKVLEVIHHVENVVSPESAIEFATSLVWCVGHFANNINAYRDCINMGDALQTNINNTEFQRHDLSE